MCLRPGSLILFFVLLRGGSIENCSLHGRYRRPREITEGAHRASSPTMLQLIRGILTHGILHLHHAEFTRRFRPRRPKEAGKCRRGCGRRTRCRCGRSGIQEEREVRLRTNKNTIDYETEKETNANHKRSSKK